MDQFNCVYAVLLYTLYFADGVVATVERGVPRILFLWNILCKLGGCTVLYIQELVFIYC